MIHEFYVGKKIFFFLPYWHHTCVEKGLFPYNQTSIVEYAIILLLVYELSKPSLYVLI